MSMLSTRLRQAAHQISRPGLRLRQRPDLYHIFKTAAIANYDEFLRIMATIGEKYGIIVRPFHEPLPSPDLGPPEWVSDIVPILRSRPEPEAYLALDLLPYVTPSGLIPQSNAELAREIGSDEFDIARAREFLIRMCDLGYASTPSYWLERAGTSLSPIDRTLLNRLDYHLQRGIADPETMAREIENEGFSFSYLKKLVIALTRRYGQGPRFPDFHLPDARRTTPDIVLYHCEHGLSARFNSPRVSTLKDVPMTATLTVDPDSRKDFLRLIQRCLKVRLRTLKILSRLIIDYNGGYLLGHTLYRRNVPYPVLRQRYPGDPKESYNLVVQYQDKRFPLHELLGYDRHPRSGYILHIPLRDIIKLRQRYADLSVKAFRQRLAEYGIQVPRSTLHRVLQSLRAIE